MASGKTLRKLIPFPKPTDNDTICADQESMMKTIDEAREGQGTFLQAGVVSSTDWSFTANITEANGELGSEAEVAASEAWLPDPVLPAPELMLSKTAKAAIAKKALSSGALPAVGKFSCIAFELTPTTWNASASVTTRAGVEQASQAAAEANPPATTAGKTQVKQVIVEAIAGPKYKIVGAQKDVRPWAGKTGALPLNATSATAWTARSGELVETNGVGAVITLPAASTSATVCVYYTAGSGEATVKTNGGKIYGDFIVGANEIKLLPFQHVLLESDSANWIIIAGEPKREPEVTVKTYTKAEGEAGVFGPTSTRPYFVNINVFSVISEPVAWSVNVNGVGNTAAVTAPGNAGEIKRYPAAFYLLPGEKWKSEGANYGSMEVKYTRL